MGPTTIFLGAVRRLGVTAVLLCTGTWIATRTE